LNMFQLFVSFVHCFSLTLPPTPSLKQIREGEQIR
jgi:hypothetical protein